MPRASTQQESLGEPRDIAGLWDALEANTDLFGAHHARTLAAAHDLAIALWHSNDFHGAVSLLNQALDSLTLNFGKNHPATLAAKGDLAAV
jgi:hypothetical protein